MAPVFVVPVGDQWLVYAPLHRVTAVANGAAVAELGAGGPSRLREVLGETAEAEPRPREGPVDPQFLGIVPTRACNLACVYCGFGSMPCAGRMAPELAVAGVNWMAEHASRCGRTTLDVHFFGGEPFAAPEVVEAVVERTHAAAAGKGLVPHLELATNGVYSEERARFAGNAFNKVVLSLDGFAEAHDRHRPFPGGRGSFGAVARTARVLSRSRAEVCLRVCVAGDNIEDLPESVGWLCEEFHPSSIDFETLQPTPESKRAGLDPPDPFLFATRFLAARRAAAGRGVDPIYAAALTEKPRLSFCPVGNDTLILHPDGHLSACYLPEKDWQARGLDLDLGRLAGDGQMELEPAAIERVRAMVAGKPRCQACFCRWSCAGGCHVNHSYPGCARAYDSFCIQTRILTACSLLCGLGLHPLADELAARRHSMERLALRPTDRLEDWEAANSRG